MKDRNSRNLILWVFLVYFFISIFMLGWLLWPFLSVIVIAATVTGVFNPVYGFLSKKLSPVVSSLITCMVIFTVLFIPIVSLVGVLSTEAYELYGMARSASLGNQVRSLLQGSQLIEQINQLLEPFQIQFTGDQLNRAITDIGRTVGLFLYEQARAITSNILKFIINFFFMLIIIFYLLIDKQRLLDFILDLSPLPDDQDQKLFQKFKDMAGAVLIGNGLSGLLQGILGGFVFAIFGLRSPFMWGVIMTILAFMPILGIGLVFLPAAVLLLLSGRIAAGMFFIVFYAALSGSVEYFIKPKLVGRRVQMHTLLVFLSIIGGLRLFGILGIIFGPLVVTAFLTLTDIYHSGYQQLLQSPEQ
jgi:predicted PurR-regulated permease PerM